MMDKPISSLLSGECVITVHTDDSLDRVENILDAHNQTYVPVVDADGSVFGIITEHDLVHFHALRKNARSAYAWEICTHRPVQVSADTPVLEVSRLMVKRKIPHVLVTDHGVLIGVVSPFDVVAKYLLNDDSLKAPQKRKDMSAEHVPSGAGCLRMDSGAAANRPA